MTVTETESAAVAVKESETVPAVDESIPAAPFVCPEVPVAVVTDMDVSGITAWEGAELSTPRPKAATATSATRLKFVVEDICVLSLVVTRNFLVAASR